MLFCGYIFINESASASSIPIHICTAQCNNVVGGNEMNQMKDIVTFIRRSGQYYTVGGSWPFPVPEMLTLWYSLYWTWTALYIHEHMYVHMHLHVQALTVKWNLKLLITQFLTQPYLWPHFNPTIRYRLHMRYLWEVCWYTRSVAIKA